jgi:predicted fused transcriptional regulator/phosphomethylpyrimidine kinase
LQYEEKIKIESELKRASDLIRSDLNTFLMPNGGYKLVYAARGAREPDQVGTLVLFQDSDINKKEFQNEVIFGEINQDSSGILTAMRFSPDIRASCSISYSDDFLKVCEDMFLCVCSLKNKLIPDNVSTIDWAVAFCSEQEEGVPDVISIKDHNPDHSSIRIFGESPYMVTTNIIKIAKRISVETL